MTYLDTAITALDILNTAATDMDAAKGNKAYQQDVMLEATQEAERQGCNYHDFKRNICAALGYSFKEYSTKEDKMVTVEGDEAPQVFKNVMSTLKKGFVHGNGSLLGFGSFAEIKERTKPVDKLADIKSTQKDIIKALKDLDNSDWADTIQGELEKLLAGIPTA